MTIPPWGTRSPAPPRPKELRPPDGEPQDGTRRLPQVATPDDAPAACGVDASSGLADDKWFAALPTEAPAHPVDLTEDELQQVADFIEFLRNERNLFIVAPYIRREGSDPNDVRILLRDCEGLDVIPALQVACRAIRRTEIARIRYSGFYEVTPSKSTMDKLEAILDHEMWAQYPPRR